MINALDAYKQHIQTLNPGTDCSDWTFDKPIEIDLCKRKVSIMVRKMLATREIVTDLYVFEVDRHYQLLNQMLIPLTLSMEDDCNIKLYSIRVTIDGPVTIEVDLKDHYTEHIPSLAYNKLMRSYVEHISNEAK